MPALCGEGTSVASWYVALHAEVVTQQHSCGLGQCDDVHIAVKWVMWCESWGEPPFLRNPI